MTQPAKERKLEWSNIQLTLQKKDRHGHLVERSLLSNLSGELYHGQLLAIMGPSGCGKTSLLNVLAGRVPYNRKLRVTGSVLFDGESVNVTKFNKQIAVVAQDDTLFSYLTVRETLHLSAVFTSGDRMSKEQLDHIVDAVLKELSLTVASETIIGSATRRGVSGGEYKRVLIGKELMKKPKTVFLDEPTSGLDAFQAQAVIESMKTLASNGKIVVAVIHQPRSSIFAMFDQLLLLSAGKLIYFGPAQNAVGYFASLGHPCPEHFNPADFFLDILSVKVKSAALEKETTERVEILAYQWANLSTQAKQDAQSHRAAPKSSRVTIIPEELQAHNGEEFKEISLKDSSSDGGSAGGGGSSPENTTTQRDNPFMSSRSVDGSVKRNPLRAVSSWWSDFLLLLWRACVENLRNYGSLVIRGGTVLFYAMILSLIYQDLNFSQQSIQDRTGLLYFMLINQSFSPLFILLDVFPNEKVIISREILSGAYPTSAYFIARVIAELPVQIILTTVYSTIIYWSVGLNPYADRYFIFLATVLLTTFTSMALGFLVSALSPSKLIANAIGPPVLIILLLFGGFYINTESLPPGSEWVRYISLVYWGFQALVINEFTGLNFECDAVSAATVGCITTGEQEIDKLNFQNGSVELSLGVLAALIIGFLIIAYIALLFNRERYLSIQPAEEVIEPSPSSQQQPHKRGRSESTAAPPDPELNGSLKSFELDTAEAEGKGSSQRSEDYKKDAQPNFATAWLGAI